MGPNACKQPIIAWDHRIAWDRRIAKRHNVNSALAFSHTHNDIVNEKQSITLHDSIRTEYRRMIMNQNTLSITQKRIPDGRSCSILMIFTM